MSLVLAGRRRICVLVLFRERLRDGFAAMERRLSRIEPALDAGLAVDVGTAERCDGRVVLSARVHRRWGRFVFGLSLFVVTLDSREPPASAAARDSAG